jgi:hypothetical protein
MNQHRTRRLRGLLILGILTVAVALRLWRIDSLPPGFHFDEAFEGLEAWRILTDPTYRPIFLTGNFGVPPLNAYANAVMFGLFQLFGGQAGPTAMRVTAALFGVLGVLAVYALGRELRYLEPNLSPAFPFLAATVLAVLRWHVHFSRMGIEPVIVPLAWALASWLLLRGWRTGSWPSFLALGAVLAACLYTYQGAWIIPFLILFTALHLALTDRPRLRPRAAKLLVAGGLTLALALPLAGFFLRNPDLLLLRPSQIAITGEQAAPAGFWQNAWATAKMFWPFGATGDLDPRRNLPGAPVLTVWLAVPFWIGLGMALWRIRRPAYSLLVVGLAGLVLPGLISEYAPHFHRILGAAAPTALLTALLLAWLWSKAASGQARKASNEREVPQGAFPPLASASALRIAHSPIIIPALILALLTITAVTSARDYFVRWAKLPELYYAFDVGLWDLGQWIARQPAATPIYLTPRPADHPTLAFAWRPGTDSHGPPQSFDGRQTFPLTGGASQSAEAYAVVEHEDFRTRLLLPEVFPDAAIGPEFVDYDGQVYARIYTRPAGSAPQYLPSQPLDAPLGDGIRLAGYEVIPETPEPGGVLFLRLLWVVDAPPTADWTVFTHVTAPAQATTPGMASAGGAVVAGRDALPGAGSLPTSRWQPGWLIVDEYQIELPADLPPGAYGLEAGLYQANSERLPNAGNGVFLGNVELSHGP